MFERKYSKLASRKVFRKRILKFTLITLFAFFITLCGGVLGYHVIAGQSWVDSFMNASMILGGMGPTGDLPNNSAKIFAGIYALFCGVVFLLGMGVIVSPFVHRFFHRFHADIDDKDK